MRNLRSRRKSLTLKDNEDILESVQYLNFRKGIFYFQGKNSKSKICGILLQVIIVKKNTDLEKEHLSIDNF